jgi:hypothetical protein
MEPSAERREHDVGPNKVWGVDNEPQWSPPVTGGNTRGSSPPLTVRTGRNGARQ